MNKTIPEENMQENTKQLGEILEISLADKEESESYRIVKSECRGLFAKNKEKSAKKTAGKDTNRQE